MRDYGQLRSSDGINWAVDGAVRTRPYEYLKIGNDKADIFAELNHFSVNYLDVLQVVELMQYSKLVSGPHYGVTLFGF